jgi:aspartate/methionine/tyrosine aminotransferase
MVEKKAQSWGDMKHTPSKRTDVLNPIRNILEKEMKPVVGHHLPMINLGLGEPSKANGFELPEQINKAIMQSVEEGHNGYTQASGIQPAREAIAEKFGTSDHPIDPDNVFLAFGCSGAL